MLWIGRPAHLIICAMLAILATACTVRLVAPYNPDLQQKASSMQAEVAAFDLTMRAGAGTIIDDPRNPSVALMINKWHGEAEAMLTLAASNDPGVVNCGEAARLAAGAIETAVPANLRTPPAAGGGAGASPSSCETALVAQIDTGLNDLEKGLKYCRLSWVDDSYFTGLAQSPATASKPPNAPSATVQQKLRDSCFAEFKLAPTAPEAATGAQHGRAVSAVLTTLQAIVYVENRKRAAEASK
jgi:hypothetical protein